MKKSLVALAALAATSAFAQSSVSISGVWDAGYKMTNAQDNTADKKRVWRQQRWNYSLDRFWR